MLVMSSVIGISYWLEENTKWIAHISGVILIIIIAAILGSTGVIPSSTEVYDWQFKWIVPFGIILMLLAFNPKNLLKINKNFILCFLIGIIATTIGGVFAGYIFKLILPEDYWRISGQLTASFIGGYENAVSVGISLNTPNQVFLQAFIGDSVLTTLWIIVNIFQSRNIVNNQENTENEKANEYNQYNNSLDITSISLTVAVACFVFTLSSYIYNIFQFFPQILWASIIATFITFTPLRHRFKGSYVIGSLMLSYFIFGCGAISNVSYLFNNASVLLLFPAIIVFTHALILFNLAKLFKIKKEIAIITSQCLIGGPATALAVVVARKWDYQFEAVTLGLFGYAVGNYFGFGVAWILK